MEKCKQEFQVENLALQSHESKMQILERDLNVLHLLNNVQNEMIESIQNYEKRVNSNEQSTLKKYSITEILMGIKVIENKPRCATVHGDDVDNFSRYDIVFLDLPEDCLNFEDTETSHPKLANIELSQELLAKYRASNKVTHFYQSRIKKTIF